MATRTRKRKNTNPKKLAAGTVISFEEPKSGRKPKTPVAKVVVQEINPVSGFVGFLREHAIVGLAVGFAIATQVQALVRQLISSFIDPLYGLFFSQKLSDKTFVVHWHGRAQVFAWGGFAYTLLDLLFVLAVIYILIKIFGLDKLDKPKELEIDEK